VSGQLEGLPDTVANRRIRLVPAGSEDLGVGHEAAVTTTRPNGSFTFANVPDGRYTLLAASSASGFDFHPPGAPTVVAFDIAERLAAPFGVRSTVGGPAAATAIFRSRAAGSGADVRATSFALNRHDAFAGRTAIDVAGGDQAGILVTLSEGVSISGRFVIDTTESRIALSALTPYLEVAAQPAGAEPSLREGRGGAVPSAPVLDFVVQDVLPGDYVFRMLGEAAMTKAVTLGGRDYTGLPLTIGDRHLSGLLVTVTSRGARIEGVVRDAHGQPAAQAAVMHFPTDPARWRRFGPQPERLRTVRADTQGRFDFVRMPAGDYFLLAIDDALADRWKDPAFLEAAARLATRVSVGWGETRTQPLTLTAVTWR
jgi:hypothetical protein